MAVQSPSVRSIFERALALASDAERHAYVEEACAGQPELRDKVAALLKAHFEAGSFLDQPAVADDATVNHEPSIAERPGSIIGPYKLLQQIGEGGMGVVFMAEQTEPIQRTVALKIIKPGMDTRQVIARFEAERQALAMMDHPNIARVLDAGTTDTGRPYFVMELVQGMPITQHCDDKQLSLRERLELFTPVCQAVQHAHQKGVIHRDIKPTNVLVAEYDSHAIPKVIDFGVAKATAQKLTELTMSTEIGQVLGTFEYMSPEQAKLNQLDVDTRSDIYSLGVVLYELLTGDTPFERKRLNETAFDEVLRIIREEEPPKPSTRLSDIKDNLPSVAACRAIEPRKMDAVVRGDLDWITMKALEKDRSRRYESASALAADIMHHLADEPVSAAAPSRIYRLHKFFERNKLAVVATAAVLAALVIGVIGTTIGLIGESRQRAAAEAAREQLQAVNKFLTDDVLAGAEPSRLPDKAIRDQIVKAMIDPAAATVAERFQDKPLVEAAVRHALASAYEAVGRGDLAVPHANRSLVIRRRELGEDHPDTLESALALGTLLRSMGMFDAAARLLRQSLDDHRRELGDDHDSTIVAITSMAMLRQAEGNFAEAESLFREALDRSRRKYDDDHELTIMSLNNLGYVLLMQGKLAEAEPLVTEALERARRVLKDNHRGTMRAIENMGALRSAQSKLAEAEKWWGENLELTRRVLGDDDPYTMDAINDMAGLLMEQGKFDEAEPLAREALERRWRVLGEKHPDSLISLNNLGVFLRRCGKLDEAARVSQDALERARNVWGENHPVTLYATTNLGTLYMAQRRYDLAEPLLLEALRRCEKVLPATHPLTPTAMYNLADLRQNQGRLDEAKELYEQALERRRRLLGDAHAETIYSKHSLAILLHMQGHADQALPLLREVLAGYRHVFGDVHWHVGVAHMHLGRSLTALGQYADAEQQLMEADPILAAAQGWQAERRQRLCENFVGLYEAWDKSDPGQGHGAKADQWRAKLPATHAAANSSAADEGN